MKHSFIKRSLSILLCTHSILAEKGVVITPITDLIGDRLYGSNGELKHGLTYETLPYASGPIKQLSACMRLHQLLFNEVVDIIDTTKDEILISVPHVFYRARSNVFNTRYWTKRDTIVSLNELKKQNIATEKSIPEPLSFTDHDSIDRQKTVSLTAPFHDPITGITFSAGTRFVPTASQKKDDTISVHALNWKKKKVQTITIPHAIALSTQHLDKQQRLDTFVSLVKQWSSPYKGVIPYVWGGCSVGSRFPIDSYTDTTVQKDDANVHHFNYPKKQTTPKEGVDCSGLVIRAAQLSGIPYFCKNSATLAVDLTPLAPGEAVEAGDLIWIPGHVMIVGDTERNTIIEARHYIDGFGWVQEIPLRHSFEGIETYAQLAQHFHSNTPLKRLLRNDIFSKTVPNYKILKMRSAWDHTFSA